MQDNRGSIINRGQARQIRDFIGLRFGNITPTDIDGLIEYHNRAYIFIELKYGATRVPFGQKLALERLTDDLEKVKTALCLIASHEVSNYEEDIDTANASVTEYRFKGKWYTFETSLIITVKEMIDIFINNLGIGEEDFSSLCLQCAKTPERVTLSTFMK